MLRSSKPGIATFRADYANRADFCEVFEKEMKPLYLLAFLLTADHKQAELCLHPRSRKLLRNKQYLRSGHDPG